jgi:hypothetical protein
MPFMDGTGPLGDGPGAGRERGMCGGARKRAGQGMGRVRRTGFRPQRPSLEAPGQTAVLRRRAGFIARQLDRIRQQLSCIGSGEPSKAEVPNQN